jgi:hypothetical protein
MILCISIHHCFEAKNVSCCHSSVHSQSFVTILVAGHGQFHTEGAEMEGSLACRKQQHQQAAAAAGHAGALPCAQR